MFKNTLKATGTVRGVFFSLGTTPSTDPQLDCAKAIIDLLNQAKEKIHIAIYSITEPNIVDSIIAAHDRGVDVQMIADAKESKNRYQSTIINKLYGAGVNIKLAIRQHSLMHNKIGIFDDKTISTGSFNWTVDAEKKNDENLIIIDGPDVASAYEKYVFQRILKNETLIGVEEL